MIRGHLEYPAYDPGVRSDPGSSGRLSSSVSRRHRVREHLAHGVSVQTEHTGRFPGAHAVYHAGSSDAKIQFHLVHPSHLPWALGIALWKVVDGPVFKRLQQAFEPSTRYTLSPPFTERVSGQCRVSVGRIGRFISVILGSCRSHLPPSEPQPGSDRRTSAFRSAINLDILSSPTYRLRRNPPTVFIHPKIDSTRLRTF